MMESTTHQERSAYFDNLRFVLIFLVVAGHFLLPLDKTRFSNNIFYLIYTFHMPCFIFVSGYFSTHVVQNGRFRADKLIQILWLYILFKIMVHVTEGLIDGKIGLYIDFFEESGAPWYLLALGLWYLSIPFIRELDPRTVMAGSIIISLLSGYEGSVDSTLALDRTLAFAPFFYAGYYMNGKKIEDRLHKSHKVFLLLLSFFTASFLFLCTYDLLMPYSNIVYGINYHRLGPELYPYGGLIRIVWYIVTICISLGFMAAVPKKRTVFTTIGSRTLQIYILHRIIRDLLQYFGFFNRVNVHSKLWIIGLLGLSFLLTAVLGNRWLAVVFDAVRRIPDRLGMKSGQRR
ncbi:acyltransferase family protein [Clostridium sp. MCC353]|uniref:acyltransferase family protein n=1 Tax=Clostridium sp. MCC353 TaxID=2592646 RepID=UPI001C022638|nr:acyltransferase family protein [Clostridium sp. MCC353]